MTFSIVAREPASGQIGLVVATAVPGGAARVPHVDAGAGALAIQGLPEPSSGQRGLDLLCRGLDVSAAIDALMRADSGRDHRQVHGCDASGRFAAVSGSALRPWAGHAAFPNDPRGGFSLAGNLLQGPDVLTAAAQTFSTTDGALAVRFLAAMRAGAAAGGDRRGLRSAAMSIRDRSNAAIVNARVDDSADPLGELAAQVAGHAGAAAGRFDVGKFYALLPGHARARPTIASDPRRA